jgi:hypothetical protein
MNATSQQPLSWDSHWSFGKYKFSEILGEKSPTLLQVLAIDKSWLRWCYAENLDDKYPELVFIRDNVKSQEWNSILNAKRNNG